MSDLSIRPAQFPDAPSLARWNVAMAHETEDRSLDVGVVMAGVRAVLEDPAKGFYLVAELAGNPVGGLMVTYEWSDWRNGAFWWIQSVYVEPGARRAGVFRRLFERVRSLAQAQGAVGLRLYVEVDNARAQQTYASLGMSRCAYHMFELDLV